MARYNERYGSEDHGLGDSARRLANADYGEQFGTGGRTQNLPNDYGTGRDTQPFGRRFRDETYDEERYGVDESPFPGRGNRGDYESLRRSERSRYGDRARREQARGYRGLGPKDYMRTDERIREDVCERLWDADDVDASEVTVQVKDAVVTLGGTVDERRIKHRIEDIVDDCSGIKDIRNEIRVQRRKE